MILILGIGTPSILNAQRQTGSVKGTITDAEGTPLPGVTIIVSGPSLIGTITMEQLRMEFSGLPHYHQKYTQ